MEQRVICKFYCKDNNINDIYIFINKSLEEANERHKRDYHNNNLKKLEKVYSFIRNNGGYKNWIIEVLENCDEQNKNERKKYWLNLLKPSLNTKLKSI